ncbi:MAG: hypothetical protein H0U23_10295 [Blastocatellia bacterium]|nr:hypothetical protein [Blastocatellia bacterium]
MVFVADYMRYASLFHTSESYQMITNSKKTRLLALFVVAFVCLNAGGGVCVAYCQTMDAVVETDDCPLKKKSKDCAKGTDGDDGTQTTVWASYEFDYCPMTVTLLAGPIEKNSVSLTQDSQAAASKSLLLRPIGNFAAIFTATFNYRGPPLLDRRTERIKHQLLRI